IPRRRVRPRTGTRRRRVRPHPVRPRPRTGAARDRRAVLTAQPPRRRAAMPTYRTGQDVTVLADRLEVPGIGLIPANTFVLHARPPPRAPHPGLGLPDRDSALALAQRIAPADIR